jgi:hypothetical protein
MAPGVEIVERIEDDAKSRKPIHIELAIFDICMVGFDLCAGLELLSDLLGDLTQSTLSESLRKRKKGILVFRKRYQSATDLQRDWRRQRGRV